MKQVHETASNGRRRARAWLRVLSLWLICGSIGCCLLAKRAFAHFTESVSSTGEQLLAWYGGRTAASPRRININGLELSLLSATSDATVHELVNRFESKCKERSGLRIESGVLAKVKDRLTPELSALTSGVLRRESDEQGIVVCVDTGRPLAPEELFLRLSRFSKDTNLASIGGLRAMIARHSEGRSQLLLLGSEGDMNLEQAFPGHGDAPGQEPNRVARPPQSRRILDAAEQGAPNALKIYESETQTGATVLGFYRAQLPREGWSLIEGGSDGALMAELGRRRILVLVDERDGGGVQTSLVELSK